MVKFRRVEGKEAKVCQVHINHGTNSGAKNSRAGKVEEKEREIKLSKGEREGKSELRKDRLKR